MTDAEAAAEALAFLDGIPTSTPAADNAVDQVALDKTAAAEAADYFDKHEDRRSDILKQQAAARAERSSFNRWSLPAALEMGAERAATSLEAVGQPMRELLQGSPIPVEDQAGPRLMRQSQEARRLFEDPMATGTDAQTKGALETIATTSPTQLVPFVSSIINTQQAADIYQASKRLAAGAPEAGDAEKVQWANDEAQRNPTFMSSVFSVVSQLPAFAGELASGGGVYRAGKAGFDQLLGAAGKAAQKTLAGRLAYQSARAGAASAAALPVTSTPRIAAEAVERATPQVELGSDAQGGPTVNVTRAGESWSESIPRAALSQWDEILTERSGILLTKLSEKLGIQLAKPAVQAVIDRIPGAERTKLMATAVRNWMAKNPTSSVGEALKSIADKSAFNGVLGETFEEHVSDVLKPVLMGITGSDNPNETTPRLWPGWREELIRLAAFSVPGAVAGAANRVGNVADRYSADAEEDARRQGPAWQRVIDEEARRRLSPENAQQTLAASRPTTAPPVAQNQVTPPNVGREISTRNNALKTPPVVPETPAEPRTPVLAEIRQAGARTIEAVQQLFPAAKLSPEAAGNLVEAVWGPASSRPSETAPQEQPADPRIEIIRKAGARTKAQIKQLFPQSQLTRERAGELRDAAWGPQSEGNSSRVARPSSSAAQRARRLLSAGGVSGEQVGTLVPVATPVIKPADTRSAIVDTIAGRMDLTEFEKKGYAPEQVTRQNWIDLQRAERRRLGQQEGGDNPRAPNGEYENYHEDAVRAALQKGEEVDPEVMADYPGLKSETAPVTSTQPVTPPVQAANEPNPTEYPERPYGENERGFFKRIANRNWEQITLSDARRWRAYEYLAGGARREKLNTSGIGTDLEIEAFHKSQVEQALRDGKPVPPEVLEEYRDLKGSIKPQAPTATSQADTPASLQAELKAEQATNPVTGPADGVDLMRSDAQDVDLFRSTTGLAAQLASLPDVAVRAELGTDSARAVAGLFGLRIVFVDSPATWAGASSDGAPGRIFVNINSPEPIMAVTGHELLHQLRSTRPDLYSTLLSAVQGLITNFTDYKASRAALGYNATNDAKMQEELLADFVGQNFTDPEFWKRLATQLEAKRPGFWRQLGIAIQDWLERIAQWLTGNGYEVSQYFTDVRAAQDAVIQALAGYAADPGSPSNLSDEVNFMLSPTVSQADKINTSTLPPIQAQRVFTRWAVSNNASIGHAVQTFAALPAATRIAAREINGRLSIIQDATSALTAPLNTTGTLMEVATRAATANGVVDNEYLSDFLADAMANMMLLRDTLSDVEQRAAEAAKVAKAVTEEENKKTFDDLCEQAAKKWRGTIKGDLQRWRKAAQKTMTTAQGSALRAAQNQEAQANDALDNLSEWPTVKTFVEAIAGPKGIPDTVLAQRGLTSADLRTWYQATLTPGQRPSRATLNFLAMLGSNPNSVAMLRAIRFRPPTPAMVNAQTRAQAAQDALDFTRATIEAPEFQTNLRQAVEAFGAEEIVTQVDKDGNRVFVHPTDPKRKATIQLNYHNEEVFAENRKKIATARGWYMDYLDPALNPNPDPLRVAAYQRVLVALDSLDNSMVDPARNKSLFDNTIDGNLWLFLMKLEGEASGDVPEHLIPFLSGVPRQRLASGLAAYGAIAKRVNEADTSQAIRTMAAVRAAAKEHGLSPIEWIDRLGNPILWSYQNQDTERLMRGDPWRGIVVTKLDVEAVDAMKLFADRLLEAAKGAEKLTRYNAEAPVLTRDTAGKTLILRRSIGTGKTVPQRVNVQPVTRFLSAWERVTTELRDKNIDEAEADRRLLEIMADPTWLDPLVLSHMESFTNPRYRKRAECPWDLAYLDVVRDWHARGNIPTTLDDVAQRILDAAQTLGLNAVPADIDEVKAQLLAELKRIVNAYTADENDSLKLFQADVEVENQLSVRENHSFMDRPRGEQFLPRAFYTYDTGSREGMNTMARAILDIPAQRHLNNLLLTVKTLERAIADMELVPGTEQEKQAVSRQRQLAGKQSYNLEEARALLMVARRNTKQFEAYMRDVQTTDNLPTTIANTLRSFIAWGLLQKVTTMVANFAGPIVMRARLALVMLRSGNGLLYNLPIIGPMFAVTTATASQTMTQGLQVFRHAMASLDIYAEGKPELKAVLDNLRKNQHWWARWLQTAALAMQQQRERILTGQALGPVNTTQTMNEIQTALRGEVYREPRGKVAEAFKRVLTLIQNIGVPLGLPARFASGLVENMSNAAAWNVSDDIQAKLERWALRSLKVQQAADVDVQQLDSAKTRLTAAQIYGRSRARKTDSVQLHAMFDRAGINLDRVIIDYWKAVDAARKAGANDVSGIRMLDTMGQNQLYVAVANMLNASTFGNRPFWLTPVSKIFSLFWGYGQNEQRQLAEAAARPSQDDRVVDLNMWSNMLMVMFGVLLVGTTIVFPIGALLSWLFYRERMPVKTLANTTGPGDFLMTAMAESARNMPMIANLGMNMAGGGNPGSSMGGYGIQFVPLSVFNNVKGAVSKALQTGDWIGPMTGLTRQYMPNSRIITNRMPGREGYVNESQLRNDYLALVPPGVETKAYGSSGGTKKFSPVSGEVDAITSALSRADGPDMETVSGMRDQAVKKLMAARGFSSEAAGKVVDRMVMARNAQTSVFGRELTADEMAQVMSRMTPRQLSNKNVVEGGRRAYAAAYGMSEPDFIKAPPKSAQVTTAGYSRKTGGTRRSRSGRPLGGRRSYRMSTFSRRRSNRSLLARYRRKRKAGRAATMVA